jgi:ADP-heptose:LPS heptosyltransferase
MPEVSPSVLIIRLDAIGDALALAPLLAFLQSREIPVDVVLRRANAGVFAARAVRDVKVAGFELRSSTKENVEAIDAFGAGLRSGAYTHVFVATEDPAGYRLAGAVGAPVRVGFADARGKPLKALWSRAFLTDTVYRSAGLDPRAPHECEVLFSLCASLTGGAAPTRDATRLRPLVLDREVEPEDYVALQITQKWERLGIPRGDVISLVRRAAHVAELRLLCARSEAAYAKTISDATGLEIAYFDELEPWKNAIGAAAALVAPDSGAMHVAGTIGTPVVAIFPPSREYDLQVARWAPWAAPHRIVCAQDDWPASASDALAALLSA